MKGLKLKINLTDIITISGKRNSGKTVLAKHLIRQMLANDYNLEIFDINNEYGEFDHAFGHYRHKYRSVSEYREMMPKQLELAMQNEDKILIFDDIDLVIGQNSIPDALIESLQLGRHRGIGMVLIFRRINSMHKQVIFNSDKFFIFKSRLKLDREYLTQNLESDYDIINLEDYQFLYMGLNDQLFTGHIDLKTDKMVRDQVIR